MPLEANLSKPIENNLTGEQKVTRTTNKQEPIKNQQKTQIKEATQNNYFEIIEVKPVLQNEVTTLPDSIKNIPDNNESSLKMHIFKDLEECLTRQKLIEEQNRKRKELLLKALADKTKQTQEEAARLHEINLQCMKLDSLLSNDVNILRKQIELASIDFMEAE